MKLTKSKLKQLILEVLKDSSIVEAEQQKKPTYTIAKRIQRFNKARESKMNFKLSDMEIRDKRKQSPEFKAAFGKLWSTMLGWENDGMPDLSTDEKPQTSTAKGPGVDAKSTTTQRGKTKTTATAGTVSTANNKVMTKWINLLSGLAGDEAQRTNKLRNSHVSFVKATVRDLFARGWNPATGMPGLLKMDKNAYKNLVKNTGWTPERMKAKLKRMTGSP